MDKDDLLKTTLLRFFSTKKRLKIIADVVDKKTPYSLRVIEWFVSNYSKAYKIKYKRKNGKYFDVYDSYKNEQLKSFSKKHFDLFRRSDKFELMIDEKRFIYTTVGQMNFFKWAIQNNILEYVNDNIKDIKRHMDSGKKPLETETKKKKFFETVVIIHGKLKLSFE
jgi:hypothetical protein